MTKQQLIGKRERLRRELALACSQPPHTVGRAGRIERLTQDLADIEFALAARQALRKGRSDAPGGIGSAAPPPARTDIA